MTPRLRSRRWLSVSEYAAAAGKSPATVRAQLRDGRLRGRKIGAGRTWQVLASELRRDDGR
jgi:hypothetical protein